MRERPKIELEKEGQTLIVGWFPKPVPQPVFFDRFGRRAKIVLGLVLFLIVFSVFWFVEFFSRVDQLDALPNAATVPVVGSVAAASGQLDVRVLQPGLETRCGQSVLQPGRDYNRVSAFLPFGDKLALSGARAFCADLQDIYYEAWTITATGGEIQPLGPEAAAYPLDDHRVAWNALNRPNGFATLAPASWQTTADLESLFSDVSGSDFASELAGIMPDLAGRGLCVDLSAHPDLSVSAVAAASASLRNATLPYGAESCLIADVTMSALHEPSAIPEVDRVVARVALSGQTPVGAPMSLREIEQAVERVDATISGDRLRFAYVTEGLAFRTGERTPRKVSYAEAMFLASRYDATTTIAAESGLLLIRYVDSDGVFNQIWLPDAEVLHRIHTSHGGGPAVLWPIGYENPAFRWIIDQPDATNASASSADYLGQYGVFEGAGPFSTTVSTAQTGRIAYQIDPATGERTGATLDDVPMENFVRFFGASTETNTLSLAFTGLPGRGDLERLLETLDLLEVPATFFLSFRDILGARGAVDTLKEAGHQVGVKLVPQGSSSTVARDTARLRNKLVQHFLSHDEGWRARFVLDLEARPGTNTNAALFTQVQQMQTDGYLVVHPTIATAIDADRVDALIDTIYDQALARSTNVLAFDISGANRRVLNETVPDLLARLRSDGFEYRALADLAQIAPAEATPAVQMTPLRRDDVTYGVLAVSWAGIQGIIFVLALIVALRSPVYLLLAFARRKRFDLDMDYHPPLTLAIPAFNEEKVIARTLDSALSVDYPGLEIVVVDDGSTDDTRQIVMEYVERCPNVHLVEQPNGGKWSALDHAIAVTETELIAILDADSLIEPMALREIVQPFKDETVGGVAGTVEVGNRGGILSAFQRLEYMHTQQVMRRAYEVFDGIIVVPGAMGAWRVEAVKKAGLVSGDTITEDADLTIAVHRAGYSIRYQEDAKSHTEAPDTISGFLRQRFRWTFGMFQASWKHKRSILERKTVGFISIVDAIWYQLITSVIYPFFDIYLIVFLLRLGFSYATTGSAGDVDLSMQISAAYLLIIMFEFVNIVIAMYLARRWEWVLLLVGPLARFGYRQLLYLASIKAIYAALMGKLAAWNKLERTGTARLES